MECDKERAIDLKNVGDADLEITNVEYFTSFPNHFSIDYVHNFNGPFPWTIPAGSRNSVYIEYLPLDVTADSSFIKVHSNDPQLPNNARRSIWRGSILLISNGQHLIKIL